ncbi:pyoverdine/dityrosine biosynthesis protein [Colletotrichum higginsianum]|nr:pyoverdine/dityrosine biosynthesis protein [Colletotrichum higginsianum]
MAISAAAPAPVSSTGAKRQLPGAPVGRPVLQLRAPTYRRPSLGSELKSPLSAISPLNASVLRSPSAL